MIKRCLRGKRTSDSQYIVKCNVFRYMRIVKYHSDVLRAIRANVIPEQKYRLLIMVHRNARFGELRMEEGPQIVKILAELQMMEANR